MTSAEPKNDPAHANLIFKLARAKKAQEKKFAAIVRLVQRREARGPAKDMMLQIRRDQQLCKTLVEYEEESEIVGMIEFMLDVKDGRMNIAIANVGAASRHRNGAPICPPGSAHPVSDI